MVSLEREKCDKLHGKFVYSAEQQVALVNQIRHRRKEANEGV